MNKRTNEQDNDYEMCLLLPSQEVSIWDWTDENNDDPISTTTLEPGFGQQKFVVFNPQNSQQLISNSDTQVSDK